MDGSRRPGATAAPPSSTAGSSQGKKTLAVQILDRPLGKTRGEVSHSAFAFLFSEMVQYAYNRISSIADLQDRLEELGFGVGQRVIELVSSRERITKRETRLLGILQFITTSVWKHLFNKAADSLERAMDDEDSCKKFTHKIYTYNL